MNATQFGESRCPVKNELSSEARKRVVAATSRDLVQRLSEVCRAFLVFWRPTDLDLRSRKRETWRDLLSLRTRLDELLAAGSGTHAG